MGEAERSLDRHGSVTACFDGLTHGMGLPVQAVEVFGAVASCDEEERWLEPPAADLDLALDGFGVDDVDAAGDDRDVVDVAPFAGGIDQVRSLPAARSRGQT
jgi:hypothetical protein